ncbi:hypothetical protein JXB41_08945 [Candidatus Woesearchaeota archaeon]|nr:hypothetical protein [Candidatus Woesearchaeota archaeon]
MEDYYSNKKTKSGKLLARVRLESIVMGKVGEYLFDMYMKKHFKSLNLIRNYWLFDDIKKKEKILIVQPNGKGREYWFKHMPDYVKKTKNKFGEEFITIGRGHLQGDYCGAPDFCDPGKRLFFEVKSVQPKSSQLKHQFETFNCLIQSKFKVFVVQIHFSDNFEEFSLEKLHYFTFHPEKLIRKKKIKLEKVIFYQYLGYEKGKRYLKEIKKEKIKKNLIMKWK